MTPKSTSDARWFCVALAMAMAVSALACRQRAPTRALVIELPVGVSPASLTVEPASAVLDRRVSANSVLLTVRGRQDAALVASAPGACPQTVVGERTRLEPVIEVPEHLPQIGWDRATVITVVAKCEQAKSGHIEWREAEGVLASFAPGHDGFSLAIRTEPLALDGAPSWGIVPISPRTRGAHLLEATWVGPRGEHLVREVHVSAMARASGVPSVAKGQELLIRGAGWHLVRANPKDAKPTLEPVGARPDLFRFRADVAGQFVLVDVSGSPLSIRTSTHERVPLDCGRGECHPSVAHDAQSSPMTHVLRNGLEGALGDAYDPTCAIACHAVGEPGMADDGFVDLARSFLAGPFNSGALQPHGGAWNELPRALRRLGGVGCTSCHGPAAIPEPTARFSILRSDVCATCHDAPPRYAHVASWKQSAMAQSDRDPEAATNADCQRCHTTAGFLSTLSSAPREMSSRAGVIGIACAACHAPHGAHEGSLVREAAVPAAFASVAGPSRICIACHEGDAASVWLGDTATPSPHSAIGCAACHLDGSRGHAERSRGTAHDFRAGGTCRTCHASGAPSAEDSLVARARAALDSLTHAGAITFDARSVAVTRPPHARGARARSPDDAALVRALVSVVEDRAAFVHNAHFVRSVVERAERAVRARPR